MSFTDPKGLFSTKDFINTFGADVCQEPENGCMNKNNPLKEFLDDLKDNASTVNGYVDRTIGLFMPEDGSGLRAYRNGNNVKFRWNKVFHGRGWKNYYKDSSFLQLNKFGSIFSYAGVALDLINVVEKGLEGKLTWCDAVDLAVGLNPYTAALTFGWDIGTAIRSIPVGNGKNVGDMIDRGLAPVFDPIVGFIVDLQTMSTIDDAATLYNYINY